MCQNCAGSPNRSSSPAVRAEAVRAIGFRELENDFSNDKRGLHSTFEWLWQTFTANPDAELRREALGVVIANAQVIRNLDQRIEDPVSHTYVPTIALIITQEFQKLDEGVSAIPIPGDLTGAVKLARGELNFRGVEPGEAMAEFEMCEAKREFPTEKQVGQSSRAELRLLRESCARSYKEIGQKEAAEAATVDKSEK